MRLIDAEAYIEQYCKDNCGHGFCDHPKCYDYTVVTLLEFPTIDPVKHGHWIPAEPIKGIRYGVKRCSCCGKGFGSVAADNEYKYCPNCGAKMRGNENDLP